MANGLTFAATSRVGAWAEREAMAYYQAQGYTVYDTRKDAFLRLVDCDFFVDGLGWVEVKGDRYKTGNFYIERTSNNSKGTIGCALYTAADYLLYYFVCLGVAYQIPAAALQEWASRRLLDFPQKRVNTLRYDGDVAYDSFGHTVPITVLLAEVPGITTISGLPLLP